MDWWTDIENAIYYSGDDIENRVAAKDLLYKFNHYLIQKRGRGFQLQNRLRDYARRPITYSLKKHFRQFYERNSTDIN